jgi:antitoxin (DNA-binding transcriptional repressor) of toxin-antitoxin stability system
MHAISVKQLREKFPFVRSELEKGESFLIIHKSKPIAELKPIENGSNKFSIEEDDADLAAWERAGVEDSNKYLESIGDFGLSEEEVKYYMSLAEPHDKRIR